MTHPTLGCPSCGMEFTPTLGQQRMHIHAQPVFCSRRCAVEAQPVGRYLRCSSCGCDVDDKYGHAFLDYLGRLNNVMLCSLECLFDCLMKEERLSLPPLDALPMVDLEVLNAEHPATSRRPLARPQVKLWEAVKKTFPQVHWFVEYSIATGSSQEDRSRYFYIDIASNDLQIAIECDDPSHEAKRRRADDMVRDMALNQIGWTTVRLTYDEIDHDLDWCLRQITKVVQEHRHYIDDSIARPRPPQKKRR